MERGETGAQVQDTVSVSWWIILSLSLGPDKAKHLPDIGVKHCTHENAVYSFIANGHLGR